MRLPYGYNLIIQFFITDLETYSNLKKPEQMLGLIDIKD